MFAQRVNHPWGEEYHPVHILNRDFFEKSIPKVDFEVVFRDYGCEFFSVAGATSKASDRYRWGLLDEKRIDMPPVRETRVTYKRIPKALSKAAEQSRIFGEIG